LKPDPIIASQKGTLAVNLLLTAVVSVVMLIAVDLAVRMTMEPPYSRHKYGWFRPEMAMPEATKYQDSPGKYREIKFQVGKYGFKRWGRTDTGKTRVLILGDSYTEMAYVANGEEWYSYLERAFPEIEFFVFGGGGYGTLQEYMVMEDHIDLIRPDLIILQFCGNDYANNYYPLELACYPWNNRAWRPYLEKGRIRYRLPIPFGGFAGYSAIIDRLLFAHDRRVFERSRNSEFDAAKETARRNRIDWNAMNPAAARVTERLFQMFKSRAGQTPIYLFPAEDKYNGDLEGLCRSAGFEYIKGLPEHLREKEKQGLAVKIVNNGHWNYEGNRLAGQYLTDYFEKNGILARSEGKSISVQKTSPTGTHAGEKVFISSQ